MEEGSQDDPHGQTKKISKRLLHFWSRPLRSFSIFRIDSATRCARVFCPPAGEMHGIAEVREFKPLIKSGKDMETCPFEQILAILIADRRRGCARRR